MTIRIFIIFLAFVFTGNAFSCEESNKNLQIFKRIKKLNNGYNELRIFTQKKFNGFYLKGTSLELQKELIVDLEANDTLEFSGNYYRIDLSISDKYLNTAYFYLSYSKLTEFGDEFITCSLPERYKLSDLKVIAWD